jgi:hypothetical protein
MMTLTVTMTGNDPVAVKVSPKVQVAAERHFKMPFARLFGEGNVSMEAVYWVGWKAMHAEGHVVKTFDIWLDELDSVDFVPEESSNPLDEGA